MACSLAKVAVDCINLVTVTDKRNVASPRLSYLTVFVTNLIIRKDPPQRGHK